MIIENALHVVYELHSVDVFLFKSTQHVNIMKQLRNDNPRKVRTFMQIMHKH